MPTELAYKVKGYRFSLDTGRFRYFPQPQEDELLSSWLVRTAFAHNADPATFINLYFPKYRNNFWNRDVDVWAPDEFLSALSEKSGLSFQALDGMTFRPYEGYMWEKLRRTTGNSFLLPLVSRGRVKRAPGLRFCPSCLAEDSVPYYRRRWRLSFATACVRHLRFLRDRCPRCSTPLTIYRRFRDVMQPHCYCCGHKLADAKVTPKEEIYDGSYGLSAIRWLYDALSKGFVHLDGRPVYSLLVFPVIRQLARIVYCWKKNAGLLDHERMAGRIHLKFNMYEAARLESMSIPEQYLLFSGIVHLLERSPKNLLAFAIRNCLGKSLLVRDMDQLPFWYQSIADAIDKSIRPMELEEVKNAIRHLERQGDPFCWAHVMRLMGACLDLRKRPDLHTVRDNLLTQ